MTTPSREDQRRQRRQQLEARQRQAQQEVQRRALVSRVRMGALVGLLALGLGLGLWWVVREATQPLPGVPVPDEGRGHVELGAPLTYASNPPSSGSHYNNTARWEFSDREISPGFWLHNLEHGGVVVLYKCPESCDELKRQLKGLYNSFRRSSFGYVKLVVAPDPSLRTTLMALAWNRRDQLDAFDQGQLQRFYDGYLDRGPENAP
ncbi:MAG: DUF3105 domain-containing protein [Chloroflexi bacterium]|nr:DUF3105 domain-containing protein [Chloroflexota bacterium]